MKKHRQLYRKNNMSQSYFNIAMISVSSKPHFLASFLFKSLTVSCSRNIAWYSRIPVPLWCQSGEM